MNDRQQRREFLLNGLKFGAAFCLAGAWMPRRLRAATVAGEAPETPGAEPPKPLEELAFCGFDCQNECHIYKATRENDLAVKKQVAEGWAKRFGVTIKPEDVACDGCRSQTGRLGYHCASVCDVRRCGRSRAISSCAVCADFPTCDKQLWKEWTAMHQRTEERRSRLASAK